MRAYTVYTFYRPERGQFPKLKHIRATIRQERGDGRIQFKVRASTAEEAKNIATRRRLEIVMDSTPVWERIMLRLGTCRLFPHDLSEFKRKYVMVTGGRAFQGWDLVEPVLAELKPRVIIEGGAPGADEMAVEWCRQNAVQTVTVPAMWGHRPKAAGLDRNSVMIRLKPDVVVAFPGDSGTADAVRKAEDAEIPVIFANYRQSWE